MRSPGHPLKRIFAIALVVLAWSLPVAAQSTARTRVWHGTRLLEPAAAPEVIVEPAPLPREFAPPRPEPERLPPIQVHVQQPPIGIESVHALIAEMANSRRIDKLEHTTSAIQKELEKQGLRQASNVESAPAKLPESALNPPAQKDPISTLKVDLVQPAGQPSLATMILTQLAAIVGSIVIVTILFFCAHSLLFRRSGGGLFKIELIGTHAPSAGYPQPVVEAIPPKPEPEPWGEVAPNFDIGPTYEEARQQAEEAERNKERALLQQIFEENQKVQEEIRSLPADADAEVTDMQLVTANGSRPAEL